MQNTMFSAFLRLIFAVKPKVIPSPIGMQNMFDLTLDLKCVRTQKLFQAWVNPLGLYRFLSTKAVLFLNEDLVFLVFTYFRAQKQFQF